MEDENAAARHGSDRPYPEYPKRTDDQAVAEFDLIPAFGVKEFIVRSRLMSQIVNRDTIEISEVLKRRQIRYDFASLPAGNVFVAVGKSLGDITLRKTSVFA